MLVDLVEGERVGICGYREDREAIAMGGHACRTQAAPGQFGDRLAKTHPSVPGQRPGRRQDCSVDIEGCSHQRTIAS